jgi:hypothetical protein
MPDTTTFSISTPLYQLDSLSLIQSRGFNRHNLHVSSMLARQLSCICSIGLLLIDIHTQYTSSDLKDSLMRSFSCAILVYVCGRIMGNLKGGNVSVMVLPILPFVSKLIHLFENAVFAHETRVSRIMLPVELLLILYNILVYNKINQQPIQSLTPDYPRTCFSL